MMLALLLSALFIGTPAQAAPVTPLTPDYEGHCQNPRWAPDGKTLSFEVNYHDRKAVEQYVVVPYAGAPRSVRPVSRGASAITSGFSSSGSESVVHELAWAPSSIGRFVYSASGPDRDYELYIGGAGAITRSPGTDGGAAWSPDGNFIVFTSARTGQGDLYLLDTNKIEEAPRQITKAKTSAELYAAWSPDSTRIAYVGHSDDGDSLYLVDAASAQSKLLTNWGRTQTRPAFSPDGKSLAFYSNHRNADRFDLYVLPLGGSARLIDEDVVLNYAGPTWTPDGRHLIYVLDDDDRFDPVYAAPLAAPAKAKPLRTQTIGNGDLDVATGQDGKVYLAMTAQGAERATTRDFRRVYVMAMPSLP